MRKLLLFGIVFLILISYVYAFDSPADAEGVADGWVLIGNFTNSSSLNESNWGNLTKSDCDISKTATGIQFDVGGGGNDNFCFIYYNLEFNRSNRAIFKWKIISGWDGTDFLRMGLGFDRTDNAATDRDEFNFYGAVMSQGATNIRSYDDAFIAENQAGGWANGNIRYTETMYNVSNANELCMDNWPVGGSRTLVCDNRDTLVSIDDYVGFIGGGGAVNDAYVAELIEVWCLGADCLPAAPPPSPSDTLNISNTEPVNGSQFNSAIINYNFTYNSSTITNFSLRINGTIVETRIDYPAGQNQPGSFNVSYVATDDYVINYSIEGYNEVDGENTTNTTAYIDRVNPAITDNFINDSIYMASNITGEFNFSDGLMIHSYNISIDGVQIAGKFDLNESDVQFNLSYNPNLLGVGLHNLTVRLADGHTAESLREDYGVSNGLFNDYIRYDFNDNDGWIKTSLKDSSIFDSWSSKKEIDRYTQTLKPDKPESTITLIEESSLPIYIKNKPGYYNDQWIIIGDHWKDYIVEDEPGAKVNIKQLSPYSVEVTISGLLNPEELNFNSVGDLNIVYKQYNFSVTNITLTFEPVVSTFQQQTVELFVNTTTDVISTNASFNYNGTSISTTKTAFGNYDLYSATFITPAIPGILLNRTLNWSYDIIGVSTNLTGELVNNQTIYNIGIDNCSTYSMKAVNLTIRNETDETLVPDSSVDANVIAWVSAMNNFTSFNLTWRGGSEYGICIFPNWTSYNFTAQMEYNADLFDKKTYYFRNMTLDNSTDIIKLYLTNDTTRVKFNVLDENDNDVADVIIKVLSYDIGTASSKVTEIVRTDSDGEAIANIILDTQWYIFILELNGVQVFLSEPTIITTTTKTFRITLGTDYFEDYTTVQDIIGNVIFTNSTLTFTYNYNDLSGSTTIACLEVIKRAARGDTLMQENCNSSSAGTMTYTIIESPGNNTYVATGTVFISGNEYILGVESANFDNTYKTFGAEGVFIAFLLIVTLTMVGVASSNPALAVFLMIFGFIGAVIIKIVFISWSALIVFIILGFITIYRITRRSA